MVFLMSGFVASLFECCYALLICCALFFCCNNQMAEVCIASCKHHHTSLSLPRASPGESPGTIIATLSSAIQQPHSRVLPHTVFRTLFSAPITQPCCNRSNAWA
jgi:hypothetical protein